MPIGDRNNVAFFSIIYFLFEELNLFLNCLNYICVPVDASERKSNIIVT